MENSSVDKVKKEKNNSNIADAVSLGANSEMLNQYSEAGKQFKVAYDGIDHETGQKLHQGLKSIAESKVNPDYANQNINQQAGYSAEVLDTAKQNAQNIKNGSSERASRTDDLGRVNDTKADQVILDEFGNVKSGSEVQMKFLKNDDAFINNVSQKKYSEHYPDGKYSVPADQYDAIKAGLKEKIAALEKQQLTPEKQKQLDYLKKVEKNLKKSEVSKTEAIEARINPDKVTIKEIAKVSHEAGVNAAKIGAGVGGGISLITNTFAVIKGEKDVEVALTDTGVDTLKAGVTSYGTGVANTAIASVMKNSSKEIVRSLGKSNAPAYIIQTAISTVKSLARLCRGEINAYEFFQEIGKNGTMLLVSAQGALIGSAVMGGAAIGGVLVGPLIGGLVCALVGSAIYDYTIGMKVLNEEIDAFSLQLSNEIMLLKEYQARLMSFDLDKFKRETDNFNVVGEHISQDHSAEDFNLMLKSTYKYLGIPCPWGEGSLDEFMQNKSGVLTFG
ncbi:MAG: hypothetical protein PHO29_09640 [Acetobacterium sp.]|nr:hypothetical protein [Acetobacterium sp.]